MCSASLKTVYRVVTVAAVQPLSVFQLTFLSILGRGFYAKYRIITANRHYFFGEYSKARLWRGRNNVPKSGLSLILPTREKENIYGFFVSGL